MLERRLLCEFVYNLIDTDQTRAGRGVAAQLGDIPTNADPLDPILAAYPNGSYASSQQHARNIQLVIIFTNTEIYARSAQYPPVSIDYEDPLLVVNICRFMRDNGVKLKHSDGNIDRVKAKLRALADLGGDENAR